MWQHYLRSAFRSLRKKKTFTIINITGLAAGLAICLLIVLYVTDELSYDRYNRKADRIFRVNTDLKFGTTRTAFANSAPPVADALIKHYPEVEKAVRLMGSGGFRFRKGDQDILEDKVLYADPDIFDVFTLPVIEGDPQTALKNPTSIVITESTAMRYFNTPHAVGQNLLLANDTTTHRITAVIRDIPGQSHFHADFLFPMSSLPISRRHNFYALFPFHTYVLLRPDADAGRFSAGLTTFMDKEVPGYAASEKQTGDYLRLSLTPLAAIHLRSNRTNEMEANGNIQYVYIFSAIALFVLLIACMNFINLATARSAGRAREVGVHKVLGSSRIRLITRFLSESVLIAAIATFLALLTAWLLLPLFNRLSGKELSITGSTLPGLLPVLGLLITGVGLAAGAYPAFFLSAFRPIDVLRGRLSLGFRRSGLRNGLVVMQFSISITLIVGTLVVYNQLRYIQNKDIGFDRNQVLVIGNVNAIESKAGLLRQDIRQLPGVTDATLSSFIPTGDRRWTNYLSAPGKNMQTQFWPVDESYLPVMGIRLAKGRNFSDDMATDSSAMIINETAANMLGYSKDPLDKKLYLGESSNGKEYHIIGVVKDFNFNSLRENVTPVAMMRMTAVERAKEGDGPDNLAIRLNTAHLSALLPAIRKIWTSFSPGQHIEYSFMDEQFDTLYRSEQHMGKLLLVFTALAILIACLGLFGLATYAAEQRYKEIGIRKILGADSITLVALLSRDFIRWVLLAVVIATPLSGWVMQKWLQGFAYRQAIAWWIFVMAGLGAIVIALLTISSQTIRTARANPVEALRAE